MGGWSGLQGLVNFAPQGLEALQGLLVGVHEGDALLQVRQLLLLSLHALHNLPLAGQLHQTNELE